MVLDSSFEIDGRRIGADVRPFVVAEAGNNHDRSLETARRLIDIAAEAGADAVKFQLFRPEALYEPGTELHRLFVSIQLDPEWVPLLKKQAESCGLVFLASSFDPRSLATLEAAGVAAHKVASSEVTRLEVIGRMAMTGKPLLMATGMCDLADVAVAVSLCEELGNRRVVPMQCSSIYPAASDQAHLRGLDTLAVFGGPTGFSDHTLSTLAGALAAARGAVVIEKHLTYDPLAEGPDHAVALGPDDFAAYVGNIREAATMLGRAGKRFLPEEREVGRRDGLHAARDLEAGTSLEPGHVEIRRPATGIRAREREAVLGQRLARGIAEGEPIAWRDIKG